MRVGDRFLDDSPYVIAEIGSNHGGNLHVAERMIQVAAACGADAVKFQKRSNRKLYTEAFYNQPYNSEAAYGPTYGTHREALEFGLPEYRYLMDVAETEGIQMFATAFDEPSVDFIFHLEMPAIKIASGDLTNTPLLKYARQTGLPLLVSTGGATMEQVQRAVDEIGTHDLVLFQCTAMYPCPFDHTDLGVIRTLADRFPGAVIGASLHDNGIAMATAAYALGATVIEKHFTLDRTMKGTDHAFSLEPQGLAKMVRDLRRLQVAIGDGVKRVHEGEREPIRKMSKAVYAARPLLAGQVITEQDVVCRSPGGGLDPSMLPQLIGRALLKDVSPEEMIDIDAIVPVAALRG